MHHVLENDDDNTCPLGIFHGIVGAQTHSQPARFIMAIKDPEHAVQELIVKVGFANAQYLLDVHKYTLYKWSLPGTNKQSRHPSQATRMLAKLFIFLMDDWNWDMEDLLGVVDQLKDEVIDLGYDERDAI